MEKVKQLVQSGQFAQALELARQSDCVEACYLQAVCLRYLAQIDDALLCLEKLKTLAPDYGRCYQEQGHCFKAQKRYPQALEAYCLAVKFNPGLLSSWHDMAALAERLDMPLEQRRAAGQIQYLSALPREMVSVISLFHEDKLHKAERINRTFLQQQPHHVEAMRWLARIGQKLHIYDDAEFLLASCVQLQPENLPARYDYVQVLHKRQKFDQAFEQAKQLRAKQPGNPSFELCYANQCTAVGRLNEAIELFDQLEKRLPDNPQIPLMKGHACKTIGQYEQAVRCYRNSYTLQPDFGDAYWSLANLKTYRFDEAEIQQMAAQEDGVEIADADRYHLCFALGKACEDQARYPQAFDYYQRGNRLKSQSLDYQAAQMSQNLKLQQTFFTPDRVAQLTGAGVSAKDPIFIVGLPRAGSTLLEQILSSHSKIDGTMELPNIQALVDRLNGRKRRDEEPNYPAVLAQVGAEKLTAFGESYIKQTQMHRQGAPYFIDKMPNNFRHIGLIKLILPNAKIIDARRDPMACCFSCYKQLFAEGQAFSYDLDDLARYYQDYVQLMEHWQQVFPGQILQVQYEQVIDDLPGQLKRILSFLAIEFETNCLDFHQTKRSVKTASAEQVRQPIYHTSVKQWQNFEPQLVKLRAAVAIL